MIEYQTAARVYTDSRDSLATKALTATGPRPNNGKLFFCTWRPSGEALRTFWTISLLISVRSSALRRIDILEPFNDSFTLPTRATSGNPVSQVLEWKRRLDKEPELTVAKLAIAEKLSRTRISQMLEIANLDSKILDALTEERPLSTSINKLRKLSRLSFVEQVREYRTLHPDSYLPHPVFPKS